MSDVQTIERDAKSGRFLAGNSGGGRKPGSRGKLTERYLADLAEIWEAEGREALVRCAREEPGVFCRLMSQLLPRDVRVDIDLDATLRVQNALEAFRVVKNLPAGELKQLRHDADADE